MKIIIIGGHLSPALSVIENLPKDWEVVFIGRRYVFEGDSSESLEYRTINKMGIKFLNLNTGRMQRKFNSKTIPSILKTPVGFARALKILRIEKPDIILGFGGYIQLPVVVAAYFLKIPVAIHEQTLEVGFSNKLSAKFAKKICVSWKSSEKFFPKEKTVFTGIPLRKSFLKFKNNKKLNKTLQIFIVGGSSGSHFINKLVIDSIDRLLEKYSVVHQTGGSAFKDYEVLNEKKNKLSKEKQERYNLHKFINPNEFAGALNNCDLVISRAGINTVSEIFIMNKPTILIPIPFSQRNEQLKNAQFLKDVGLAEILEQKSLTSAEFLAKIDDMIKNIKKYTTKSVDFSTIENAPDKIIKVLKECIREK